MRFWFKLAKNRRKYIRLKVYHLAKYKLIHDPNLSETAITAWIRNISAGGCCMTTDKSLPVNSIIRLEINFPQLSKPIYALAKVVWTRQVGETKRYEFGIEFIEIDESLRKTIDGHIKFVFGKLDDIPLGIFLDKGGERQMKLAARLFLIAAFLCVLLALVIKLTTLGTIMPAAMPINWIRLTDTALLFTIALALLSK